MQVQFFLLFDYLTAFSRQAPAAPISTADEYINQKIRYFFLTNLRNFIQIFERAFHEIGELVVL